jgi:hypothetical protein
MLEIRRHNRTTQQPKVLFYSLALKCERRTDSLGVTVRGQVGSGVGGIWYSVRRSNYRRRFSWTQPSLSKADSLRHVRRATKPIVGSGRFNPAFLCSLLDNWDVCVASERALVPFTVRTILIQPPDCVEVEELSRASDT